PTDSAADSCSIVISLTWRLHDQQIRRLLDTPQNAAIAAYVRWHNARAGPKTNFVPASPIRSWTE
ncbi:hypothetical protein ABZ402_43675, partial [Streptomyces mirabilis]|uniref:hypothetical protein n=1 Tax=Streptomyces mirabilis TaxID=68239 RepID=UPI0033D058D1